MGKRLGRKVYQYGSGPNVMIFCPGCGYSHIIFLDDSNVIDGRVHKWTYNGNADAPTFSPSLNVNAGHDPTRCHTFITDGQMQRLGDCAKMPGVTVELPDWPDDEEW